MQQRGAPPPDTEASVQALQDRPELSRGLGLSPAEDQLEGLKLTPCSPGFVQAALRTEEDRAAAFTRYVTEALRDPRIVGCHWHRYTDDPVTGNLIGENNQWGFVDICDTPYEELIAASREIGETMFAVRLGEGAR